jgi:hypothetical protein
MCVDIVPKNCGEGDAPASSLDGDVDLRIGGFGKIDDC